MSLKIEGLDNDSISYCEAMSLSKILAFYANNCNGKEILAFKFEAGVSRVLMTVAFPYHRHVRLLSKMGNDLQFESVNPRDSEEAEEFNTFQEALAHEWEIEGDYEACSYCGEDVSDCECPPSDEGDY